MKNGVSKRIQARSAVIEAIRRGTFAAGAKIPGERDLCRQLGVSRVTLGNVLRDLARDGWLERRVGSGTIVSACQAPPERSERIRNVGLVMSTLANPVVARLIEGLHRVLPPDTCNLILKDPLGDPRKEMRYVEHLIAGGADALVVMTHFPFDSAEGVRFYRAVRERHPLVMTDSVLQGDIPTIEVDNMRGGALAAEYLLATRPQARRFWVLQGHEEISTVNERRQGFASVLAERAGIDLATITQTEDEACCRDRVAELARAGLPDGIFMTSERIVVPLLKAFIALGIARDGMALCCFDNFHSLASLYGIAHIEQPLVEVGMEIARYLQVQHGGRDEAVRKLKLIPRLVPPEQR